MAFDINAVLNLESGDAVLYDLEHAISFDRDLVLHSGNVEEFSVLIFKNLPSYELPKWKHVSELMVARAGRYHDIGKNFLNGFYEGLLSKPRFDDDDYARVKEHTFMGATLLACLNVNEEKNDRLDPLQFELIMDACLFHHERTDGSGYLHLSSVPPIAELIAVADCFSAGTEKRVYSGAKSEIQLLTELREMPLNQIYVRALEKGLTDRR